LTIVFSLKITISLGMFFWMDINIYEE